METLEYKGANGYTMIERNVLSEVEKLAHSNTHDVCGIHRCITGKTHGSKRMLGFNPKHVDNSPEIVIKISPEHREKLLAALEAKREREKVRY